MLAFLAAALMASSSAESPASPAVTATVLESAVPWWEKITVTVDHQGKQQSCRYETNLRAGESCGEEMAASIQAGGKASPGQYSKITFERRFSPGGQLDAGQLQPGDVLLGRQVMFLTFDAAGAIASCKVVARAGDVPPSYGCEDARKEQFRARASAEPDARQAFMTILAYGHMEHIA